MLERVAGTGRTALLFLGLLVVGLIAAAATVELGSQLDVAWSEFPDAIGVRFLALVAAYLAAVGAALVMVLHLDADVVVRWMPWAAVVLLVAVRLLVIPLVETPLPASNDPLFHHQRAVEVASGDVRLIDRVPMGFQLLLGGLYAAFGVHPWLGELLNVAMAAVTGLALHAFVRRGWGWRDAAVAVTLFALAPSQILLATTLYTETMYGALLMLAMATAAAAFRGGRLASAVAAGALLGLSQYVRPISQAFLAAFVVVPFLAGAVPRRAAVLAASCAVAFLLILTPVVVHNLTVNGALSTSTSSFGGWGLYVGTNQGTDGLHNRTDLATLQSMTGSVWERSDILGREGIQRITDHPLGFAGLVVRKFPIMWGDDGFAARAALVGSSAGEPLHAALELASQAVYAGVAVAAAVSLWRLRRQPPFEMLLAVAVIATVAAAHTFLEVQPRYHAYVVPLLCALAAPVLAAIFGGRGRTDTPPIDADDGQVDGPRTAAAAG